MLGVQCFVQFMMLTPELPQASVPHTIFSFHQDPSLCFSLEISGTPFYLLHLKFSYTKYLISSFDFWVVSHVHVAKVSTDRLSHLSHPVPSRSKPVNHWGSTCKISPQTSLIGSHSPMFLLSSQQLPKLPPSTSSVVFLLVCFFFIASSNFLDTFVHEYDKKEWWNNSSFSNTCLYLKPLYLHFEV